MNPGRELDALVAEKVMGWKREGKNSWLRPEHRPSKDFPGKIINDWDSKGEHDFLVSPDGEIKVAFCGCDTYGDVPSYSTDIAAAWEVVEKLAGHNHDPVVSVSVAARYLLWVEIAPAGDYRVEIRSCEQSPIGDWYEKSFGTVFADTAPHAICLAALKAVGEK